MRHARIVFALFGFATALMAADPFVGTWKFDAGKSKYKTGAAPKEQTIVISESGSDLDVSSTGTSADGTALSNHYTVPAKGGEGKMMSPSFDAVSSTRPGAKHRVTNFSKGGKVVYTVHARLSADGKTMTTTVKGTNAQGKQVDGANVYVKQ